MPEEAEKPDYIITDAETRHLMAMLMGEWKSLDLLLALSIKAREDELLGGAGDKEGRRRELLEGASRLLRENINDVIRDGLDMSLDEVERIFDEYLASGQVSPRKRRRKRVGKPAGRPPRETAEEVEMRSIRIIRALRAGPGDLQKVAMVYYQAGAHIKAGPEKRKQVGDRYAMLLKRRGLNYPALVEKARRSFAELIIKSTDVD